MSKRLPPLPDEVLEHHTGTGYHLSVKDAQTLMMWDEGEVGVISYYKDVVEKVTTALGTAAAKQKKGKEIGKIVGNWCSFTPPFAPFIPHNSNICPHP